MIICRLIGFVTLLGALTLGATPIQSVRALPQAELAKQPAVTIRGVVTAFSGWKNSFFLQDRSGAISVDRLESTDLKVGDDVEVSGHVRAGLFAPIILSDRVAVLGTAPLPKAQAAAYSNLITGALDSVRVQMRGVIHAAQMETMWGKPILLLRMQAHGEPITIHVLDFERLQEFDRLVDSEVEVSGVAGTVFNDRRQLVGLRMFVASLDEVRVVRPMPDPALLPAVSFSELLKFGHGTEPVHRIKVTGTVTYQAARHRLYLEDQGTAIRVQDSGQQTLLPGARVNVVGFLALAEGSPMLVNTEIKLVGEGTAAEPAAVRASQVIVHHDGFAFTPYENRLIRLRAVLNERLRGSESETWRLQSEGVSFEAVVNRGLGGVNLDFEPGSEVSVTGICLADLDDKADPQTFHLQLRSAADAVLVRTRYPKLSLLILALLALFLAFGAFGVWLFQKRITFTLPAHRYNAVLFRRLSSGLCLAVAAVAAVELMARWRGVALFSAPLGNMGPNVALGLLIASLIVLLERGGERPVRRRMLAGAAVFVILVGMATCLEYLTCQNYGIDWLLIPRSSPHPSRMSPAAAFCLVLMGAGWLLRRGQKTVGVAQVLALITATISLLDVLTRLYGVPVQDGVAAYTVMALSTALSFQFLSLALLFRSAEAGLMRVICSRGAGGLVARHLLPAAFIVPVLFGWLRLQGQLLGYYDTLFGIAIFALANVVFFSFLVWISASTIDRFERGRTAAQAELIERDGRLKRVFQESKIGDFRWTTTPDEVVAHPMVWALYGDPEHAERGPASWFRERQHPEDLPRIEQASRVTMETGSPLDVEFRIMLPSGEIRWVETKGTAERDASGSITGIVGIAFDISDRKRAELAREESDRKAVKAEESLQEGLQFSKVVLWVWDTRSNRVTWTGEPKDVYGLSAKSLANYADFRAAVHPDDIKALESKLGRVLIFGEEYQAEFRVIDSEGQVRWIAGKGGLLRDEAGEVCGMSGVNFEITDKKRAEAEILGLNQDLERRVEERSAQLAESERRFRLLIEGVQEYAIFMLDVEGYVVSWNAGAERLKQYKSSEIVGKHFSIFYPAEVVATEHPRKELELAVAQGRYSEEGWRVRQDGSQFWAHAVLTPIYNALGELSGFSKITRDMSEQKRNAQRLMAERRRAEEANDAKSSFLAAMSHEIRTPMNAILGMADLLWASDLNTVQKDYVGRFRRAGATLLTLINEILDLSKIESGGFELEHIDFDLQEVVERTVELMAPRAQAKKLELAVRIAPETPKLLVGDPSRLQQVLLNLLGNAVKFTEHGEVSLMVCAMAGKPAGHLEFLVKDSGIGIAEDKLSIIFKDFTQAESSTTRRFGGTGLGLGIARRLIHRMNGRIEVSSRLGEGSVFRFDAAFPISQAKTESRLAEEAEDFAGRRVLIVDDNATNQLIFREMCAGWGMITSQTCSPLQALDQLREAKKNQAFSLVILDHLMDEMSGFEMLGEIQRIDRHVPVLLTTSDNQSGDLTKAKQLGAAEMLTKPIRKADLWKAIAGALQIHRVVSEKQPVAAATALPVLSEVTPMKVLVADDSEDNRFLIGAYLNKGRYALSFVENGMEAVTKCREQVFDLILMDVQMPVMDGLTATSTIRQWERRHSRECMPIVALTANALVEDIARSKQAGCNAHLSKPISKEKLIEAIEAFRPVSANDGLEFNAWRGDGAPTTWVV